MKLTVEDIPKSQSSMFNLSSFNWVNILVFAFLLFLNIILLSIGEDISINLHETFNVSINFLKFLFSLYSSKSIFKLGYLEIIKFLISFFSFLINSCISAVIIKVKFH